MLTGIDAIVFDLDGTLYQSESLGVQIAACADRYLADLLRVSPEEAGEIVRRVRRELTARFGREASLSDACRELGGDLRELHRRFAAEVAPEPHLRRDSRVVQFLRTLGASRELYLYTNNNRALSGRIMDAIGVTGLFRRVVTIEDNWRPKPDLQVLDALFADIGRKPSECLFVGDRYDIDLRLPAELGCSVYLSRTVDELLGLTLPLSEGPQ